MYTYTLITPPHRVQAGSLFQVRRVSSWLEWMQAHRRLFLLAIRRRLPGFQADVEVRLQANMHIFSIFHTLFVVLLQLLRTLHSFTGLGQRTPRFKDGSTATVTPAPGTYRPQVDHLGCSYSMFAPPKQKRGWTPVEASSKRRVPQRSRAGTTVNRRRESKASSQGQEEEHGWTPRGPAASQVEQNAGEPSDDGGLRTVGFEVFDSPERNAGGQASHRVGTPYHRPNLDHLKEDEELIRNLRSSQSEEQDQDDDLFLDWDQLEERHPYESELSGDTGKEASDDVNADASGGSFLEDIAEFDFGDDLPLPDGVAKDAHNFQPLEKEPGVSREGAQHSLASQDSVHSEVFRFSDDEVDAENIWSGSFDKMAADVVSKMRIQDGRGSGSGGEWQAGSPRPPLFAV